MAALLVAEEVADDGEAWGGANVVAGSRVYRDGQWRHLDAPIAGRGLDRHCECIAELGRDAGRRTDEAVVVILVPRSVRVYFATQPTNLRMSFEGLSNAVREVLRQDPLAGHIFVFLNRRKNMVKLLVYTRGGYTIVHKRLAAWSKASQVWRSTCTSSRCCSRGSTSVARERPLAGSRRCTRVRRDRQQVPDQESPLTRSRTARFPLARIADKIKMRWRE